MLAGRTVPDDDVRELVGLLRDQAMEDVAHKLDHALLTLDDPQTDALAELRATLLLEHEWRVREGLV